MTTLGNGLLLPELKLALDTSAPGYASIMSHAHGDHIPWEAREAWMSPESADLVAMRKPDLRPHALPWREPARVGAARVTLRPAGHILGSATVHIEAPDGETLLYTGDTKLRASLTAEPAEYAPADVLVIESTFGLPIFRFPPYEQLHERMTRFARETLAAGEVPVFLGYALGKAQEIVAVLDAAGIPVVAHGAVWNVCETYRRHGYAWRNVRPYAPGTVEGAALVVPPSFRGHPMVTKLKERVAYCSGWALLSKSRVQVDADCLVPLSDHADHPDLLDIVRQVGARRVLANHGYADVFAHVLRKQGLDAQPLLVGHTEEDTAPGEPSASPTQRTLDGADMA